MPPPAEPKIYHIVHVDRLASIVADGGLWSDAALQRRARPGTTIGMSHIKQWRLTYRLKSRPGLRVGVRSLNIRDRRPWPCRRLITGLMSR